MTPNKSLQDVFWDAFADETEKVAVSGKMIAAGLAAGGAAAALGGGKKAGEGAKKSVEKSLTGPGSMASRIAKQTGE